MGTKHKPSADGDSTAAGRRSDLKVFISHRDSTCDECHEALGREAWIFLERERGALCLACADLDQLEYLPAGDVALTRRAKKYSRLSAVVLKFSRARGRYERQGLLVEEEALARAEVECLADAQARERRRQRESDKRAELDRRYVELFSQRIRQLFPACPREREVLIAEHACRKYSGRVGRSAAARQLQDEAIQLAIRAHVRHVETNYDELLGRGWQRSEARHEVLEKVNLVLASWAGLASASD